MKIITKSTPTDDISTYLVKNPQAKIGRNVRIRLKPLKKESDTLEDVSRLLHGVLRITKGGPGSGDWGHRGRPGKVGGSAKRGGFEYEIDGEKGTTRHTISRADIQKRRQDRKSSIIDLSYEIITKKLRESEVTDRENIDGGMSDTFTGNIEGIGKVIDKPIDSLYYYSGDDYYSKRNGAEFPVAAGDIAENFGWDEVPPSEISKDGKYLRSVFKNKTVTYSAVEYDVTGNKEYVDSLERLAVVDHIIGQQDGHDMNYVVDKTNKKVYGIDYNIAGRGKDRITGQVPERALTTHANFWNGEGYNKTPLRKEFVQKFLSSVKSLKFSPSVPKYLQAVLQGKYDRLVAAMRDNKNYSDNGEYFFMDRSY